MVFKWRNVRVIRQFHGYSVQVFGKANIEDENKDWHELMHYDYSGFSRDTFGRTAFFSGEAKLNAIEFAKLIAA